METKITKRISETSIHNMTVCFTLEITVVDFTSGMASKIFVALILRESAMDENLS